MSRCFDTPIKRTPSIMGYLRQLWLPEFFSYWCCCYCGCGCCSGCPTTALTACHPMPPLLPPPCSLLLCFLFGCRQPTAASPFCKFQIEDRPKKRHGQVQVQRKVQNQSINRFYSKSEAEKKNVLQWQKNCSTLSTSTKFRKFAIALALSSNAHFKNILLFFRQCGQMMFSSTADKTRPR